MLTTQLESISKKTTYQNAVRFIKKLMAAGVPLENIRCSNFESPKGMEQGVFTKGKNIGLPNGTYPNRHVIVIPVGEEGNSTKWAEYRTYRDADVLEAIELGTVGIVGNVKKMKDTVVGAVVAKAA